MDGICEHPSYYLMKDGLVANRRRYVGTEDGILEYSVNIDARKTFPGIQFQ